MTIDKEIGILGAMAVPSTERKYLKTIRSHTGMARFLAECGGTDRMVPRSQFADVPSPYRHSPEVNVLTWKGQDVVWFEVAHRVYKVYPVEPQ